MTTEPTLSTLYASEVFHTKRLELASSMVPFSFVWLCTALGPRATIMNGKSPHARALRMTQRKSDLQQYHSETVLVLFTGTQTDLVSTQV